MRTTNIPQDAEHIGDWKSGEPQATVDAIVGNYDSPFPPDSEDGQDAPRVLRMVNDQQAIAGALKELWLSLNQANNLPVQRTTRQGTEVNFKTVFAPALKLTRVCATNYNRQRILLSGFLANVFLATDKNVDVNMVSGTVNLVGDAVAVGYAAATIPWQREIYTLRDLYVISLTDTQIGVQEEFMSGQ